MKRYVANRPDRAYKAYRTNKANTINRSISSSLPWGGLGWVRHFHSLLFCISLGLHYLCTLKTKVKPMHKIAAILMFLAFASAVCARTGENALKVKYPGGRTYMFRVELKDKNGTPFSLDRPSEFLSAKALERRNRQHLRLDSTDLPVNPAYINEILSTGVEVVGHSKWNNTVLVRSRHLSRLKSIALLGCVKSIRKVWTSPDSISPAPPRARYHTEFNHWETVKQSPYGVTLEQTEMVAGEQLHSRGYRGRGMTIAVLDGGFMNADRIPCLKEARVVGTADFVVPRSESIFKEMDHGTKVLSVMAADVPGTFVGAAPDASFWLLRCEDGYTESLAEEDYWAAAAEFADSVGVDIISSSLGFHAFDSSADNYTYRQLDGHTALISRSASMLAAKGILLINSAGNDGMASWKKINVPADAQDIITVGAVTPDRLNASFSSIGPTADGRIKPDVMAQGSPTAVITGRGTIIKDVGTSFATPLVAGLAACLWQALPGKTALQMVDLLRRCADNAATPDNIYGYGIPDFWKAYEMGKE